MSDKNKWQAKDIPDLSGRTYVVTGATSGLGLASALEFARHGGRVIVTGRNPQRLASALDAVGAAATGEDAISIALDLASLASIREAAAAIAEATDAVDVLLNNAGVMATPRGETKDGFELQVGTNHLGHFALTGLLLPLIPHGAATADGNSGNTATPGRVVTVASIAHKNGKVVVDDLFFENRKYSPMAAYGQSKLANLLFTAELARKAKAANWNLIAAAAHPGLSATNLFRSGSTLMNNPIVQAGNKAVELVVSQSAEDGALPSLYAATAPGVISGDYYGPDGIMEIRGNPKRANRTAAARDEALAADLWRKSEELTDVHYNFEG